MCVVSSPALPCECVLFRCQRVPFFFTTLYIYPPTTPHNHKTLCASVPLCLARLCVRDTSDRHTRSGSPQPTENPLCAQ